MQFAQSLPQSLEQPTKATMLESRLKIKNHVSPILAWCVLGLGVQFCATTSRFSFILVNDKVTHASVFCLMFLVLGWQAKDRSKLAAITVGLFMIGCGIELIQDFVPQRTASIKDVLANMIGLVVGYGIVSLFGSKRLSGLAKPLPLQFATKPPTAGARLVLATRRKTSRS